MTENESRLFKALIYKSIQCETRKTETDSKKYRLLQAIHVSNSETRTVV